MFVISLEFQKAEPITLCFKRTCVFYIYGEYVSETKHFFVIKLAQDSVLFVLSEIGLWLVQLINMNNISSTMCHVPFYNII